MEDSIIMKHPAPSKNFLGDEISNKILELLMKNGPMTITNIIHSSPDFRNFEFRQMHDHLNKLYETGQVKKVIEGRYSLWAFNSDILDVIKKYKELLDMGAITQEEFDEKKKQLLGM